MISKIECKFWNKNGYWNVSSLHPFFAVKVKDYDEKEKLIHTIFSKSQVSTSELFALDKDIAKEMLDAFDGEQIYPQIIEKQKNTKDAHIIQGNKKKPVTFAMLNIPIGLILTFAKDETIICRTFDNINKVEYNDKIYSLSSLGQILLNYKYGIQKPLYFKYNGKTLVEISEEMKL